MSNTADVIVIGGGVQGASLAFHLAQRGVKVTVIEKQFVGAGATGRSSGLVRMHYDTEVESKTENTLSERRRGVGKCPSD